MFKIGDKIVYPVQGAGVIDVIEEKEFHGEKQTYYNISLINNSMKLTMPFQRLQDSNIRLISTSSTLDNVLLNISNYEDIANKLCKCNSKERLEINNNKLKSGSLEDIVEVILTLNKTKKIHSLNSSENQVLLKAKKILTDEICLAKDISKTEAIDLVDSTFNIS